jgi:hypothetical protein
LGDVAESWKIKVGPKKRDGALELIGLLTVSDMYKEVKDGLKATKCWCGTPQTTEVAIHNFFFSQL